jgi:hypothetical protein
MSPSSHERSDPFCESFFAFDRWSGRILPSGYPNQPVQKLRKFFASTASSGNNFPISESGTLK